MEPKTVLEFEARQAYIPQIPCAECRAVFSPNEMHFAVEHGHAVHRCFACAQRIGILHDLDASDRSAAEEEALFQEMIESDPMRIAHFVRDRLGGGDLGLKIYSDLLVNQVLVTAALKPGSKNVLDGLKFIHQIFVSGAQDRRAEQDLTRKSDFELEQLARELLQKAIVKDVPNNIPALPAVSNQLLPAPTGGPEEVAGVAGRAGPEAVREPQPVGTPA